MRLAERAGCAPDQLIDFSASLNPLGPPPWLGRELAACEADAARYPDPSSSDLCLAACERYKVWPDQVMAGNGASELLFAAAASAVRNGLSRAVIPVPAYGDYERLAGMVGLEPVFLPLDSETGFALDFGRLAHELSSPSLVFLCNPGNPTGRVEDGTRIASLAEDHPDSLFVVDESFADFVPVMDRLVRDRPDNVVTVVSLTKFYSVPGLRIGLAFSVPEMISRMKRVLPSWSVNVAAQRVGARGLRDLPYQAATRARTRELREGLALRLGFLPGIKVFDAQANSLLCRTDRLGDTADPLVERMLAERMAIRPCKSFRGLDERYFRIAVRSQEDNDRLADAMEVFYGVKRSPVVKKPVRKPAIMVQGASSNAGKSVIAAALCRIFLQDGFSVAPFKAQNMSLNSYVTADGGEMGRAQVTQAMACRLEPDVRMNPVLLKPGSDTGSQVIVNGRPVGNMNVAQYVEYKPRAFEQARRAYDQLAAEHDVMVIEGAGSPAEINLKHHDIVNMRMAEYAKAPVILVGDIDRGGVFASLVGTMELLTPEERDRVCGYVLNRFRGDESLLDPAIAAMRSMTGKPVLGTVPYIHRLGLPEEDSVSFKAGEVFADSAGKGGQALDVAVVDLGHISNFNDVDPLAAEPDVSVRVVRSPLELGRPDAVILPGSKNTVADMRALKGAGMAAALRSLPESATVVGICGGFQMLGAEIADPHRLETDAGTVDGFGLLALRTTLAHEKTLTRVRGEHVHAAMPVHGYEIHHGVTEPLSDSLVVSVMGPDGPLGYGTSTGRVWGTYLHGVFDDDDFRRWFVDSIRVKKGLDPVGRPLTSYGIEAAIDHLASVVREHLDMGAVYRAMGLGGGQLSLFG